MIWVTLAGSLAAVLFMAGMAKLLGLGGDVRLDRDAAMAIATGEGFAPNDLILDKAGMAAIVRDAAGRHMLIRRHGVHFVTRLLRAPLDARLDQNFLTIGTGEASFGRVTLDLGKEAAIWAAGMRNVR